MISDACTKIDEPMMVPTTSAVAVGSPMPRCERVQAAADRLRQRPLEGLDGALHLGHRADGDAGVRLSLVPGFYTGS